MDTRLFTIDPYALSSYGMYNSIKGEEGSFEDFLLHYDSKSVNDGDNSWFTKMLGIDTLLDINSPQIANALAKADINTFDFLNTSDFFDTQANAYKLKLQMEAQKRGVDLESTQLKNLDI